MHKAPAQGCCLAFDFGESRIGVAQGECSLAIAHPLATVSGRSNEEKFAAIAKLVAEWQPVCLLVGLPVYTDGGEHRMTELARKFRRFALPVYWADERLSSLHAEALLSQAQVFGKKRKAVLDQVAAQAILESFFHSGAAEYYHGNAADSPQDAPCP